MEPWHVTNATELANAATATVQEKSVISSMILCMVLLGLTRMIALTTRVVQNVTEQANVTTATAQAMLKVTKATEVTPYAGLYKSPKTIPSGVRQWETRTDSHRRSYTHFQGEAREVHTW